MGKVKKWEIGNYYFLKINEVVSTNKVEELGKYYVYEEVIDEKYKIVDYKEDLLTLVYDICYGEYVDAYQNIMVDKYLGMPSMTEGKTNRSIANIITKACFRIGIIKLTNLFNERSDQLFSINTLEVLIKNRFERIHFEEIRIKNEVAINSIKVLRDKFYAHRDPNCEIDVPKKLIWNLINDCDSYFTSIQSQIGSPKNYKNYVEVDYHAIKGFINP